ncbi:TetR/AcrR family transcriptional regulator C-terminal domain-containing protein [Nonomuraea sp. 3N208]|uniref:TetR/AcrR family transcriptional regulator C-terminal domain-containing protein n=1 Tax=Nonomuraea sp. 3N208 TaxID=3457421 RepID=UPI003FD4CF0F
METLVGILRPTGLPPARLRGVVALLFDFVRGAARTVAESRQAPSETGVSDEEWWKARSALLERVAPGFAARYPLVRWVESEDDTPGEGEPWLRHRARQTFKVGLAVLLDGVEAASAGD